MNNIFYKLYKTFKTRKLLLISFLVVVLSGLLFFSLRLNLEEDITKLLPESEETKTLNKVLKNTDFSDKIIVNISIAKDGTIDDLTTYASEILDSIQIQCSEFILNVQGEIQEEDMIETIDFINANLPLFLEDSDYDKIKHIVAADSLSAIVQNNYKTLISPSGIIAKKLIRQDPFGLTIRSLIKLEKLKISDDFEIYNGFLITKSKLNLLLFIKPNLPTNETDSNRDFVEKLVAISEGLNKKYAHKAQSEYYGSTVIAVENANQIKKDIQYTVGIALSILFIILISYYRKFTIPILLFIPTIFGALIAIVTLSFLRDNISAISLGIGSVLLGITLDYSLHILTHFKKNNDVRQLYRDVTRPILMSSITTATAFICLLLLKSQALQDLGIFAAISVLSASLIALFIVPLLYKPQGSTKARNKSLIESVANYRFDKSWILILACFTFFILGLFTYKYVKFNKDLNKMNYQSPAMLEAQGHLDSILKLSSKSIYLVAYGDNMEDVFEANTAISKALDKEKELGEIVQYSSNGSIVLSKKDQMKKIEKWNLFWTNALKRKVKEGFIKEGKKVDFKESTYVPFFQLIDKEFSTLNYSDYSDVSALMTDEYISSSKEFYTAVSLVKLKGSQKGKLQQIVKEIPNTLLIDRKEISESFLGGLKDNFSDLINYSFLAIVIILLLFFRNLELTVLTVIPIAITWFITLGIMGLFGIEFTIFNAIISTFIFGLGVDYSIFMTNALVKDYSFGTKEINTYKVSIILSVITTLLGVGVLIFAKHPALRSISILSVIGILVTVLVVFTIQPLIFRIFVKNRASKGFSPLSIRLLVHSSISLLIYGLGGMLLSLFSITILQIIPISKKIKFKWLHKTAARLLSFVLYTNPFVRKNVVNDEKEKFDNPAIIIANHASSLDTLTLGLLTPNIVYLINDWVYKSPVFGLLARVMGYYPITRGVDNSTDYLLEKVNQGYSLVVFPESKRSFSNKVGRFHKGAFFLQEQLKLDILPIFLHGNSEVMPKNDFIIYDGSITVIVGKRISYVDNKFGTTYRDRNKKISQYYKNEFLKIRNDIEKEDYFKKILFSNYIYKNQDLLNAIKMDFKVRKKVYNELNIALPMKSKILHLGDDFGQLDILLVSKSIERKITSLMVNDHKRAIAKNCYTSRRRGVEYVSSTNNMDLSRYDILLLSGADGVEIMSDTIVDNFDRIMIVDSGYPIEKFNNLEYSRESISEKVVLLKRINR